MADYVMDTVTTAVGWNSYDDLIRSIGYTSTPLIQDGLILRPTGGAVEVYVKFATVKPTLTDATTLGKALLAAGEQFAAQRFPSTQCFIYTVSATTIVVQANAN